MGVSVDRCRFSNEGCRLTFSIHGYGFFIDEYWFSIHGCGFSIESLIGHGVSFPLIDVG